MPPSSPRPICWQTGFVHGGVGLGAFTEKRDPRSQRAGARGKGKIRDRSGQSYPSNYTGHIRATLRDGTVIEERQPHMRGGAQEPLTRQDVVDKFALKRPAWRLDQGAGWCGIEVDGGVVSRQDRSIVVACG